MVYLKNLGGVIRPHAVAPGTNPLTTLICTKLNYHTGTLESRDVTLTEDAFYMGNCEKYGPREGALGWEALPIELKARNLVDCEVEHFFLLANFL